ncbi:splicing factor YJU2 [Typha latifolia]|uniref:splicing factor YJU2 n=1 Tax=Typha latifolia TaxID=4733 RepID=UPI003C2C5607
MGERKVLNKYYPPDFDPAKIPRRRQPKNQQMKVRMMLPMSIRCNTCGTYIYKGTKFNSRKEDAVGEAYLGIQKIRFYIKCTRCSAEITFKTDPQNSDYTVESGAARNFEPWRDEEDAKDKEKRKRDAEEMGDAMKSLENRALDSKQDMDILAALEEMRSMKSRHATVSFEDMLETLKRSAHETVHNDTEELDEADEALIKSITFQGSKDYVRRLSDDEDDDIDEEPGQSSFNSNEPLEDNVKKISPAELPSKVQNPTDVLTKASTSASSKSGGTRSGSSFIMPKFVLKPRPATDVPPKRPRTGPVEIDGSEGREGNKQVEASKMETGLQSLCQNYNSDESE